MVTPMWRGIKGQQLVGLLRAWAGTERGSPVASA
jgi:hypothetical protein